jgi:hypothetical protein
MGWNHFIGNTVPAPTPQIVYVTPAPPAPTKTVTPAPTQTPAKTSPDGITIGPVNLGNGQFTAAIIDPAKWRAGGGKIEMRTWSDNEDLYTVMLRNSKGELEYSSQCMYRLKDNTLISVHDDPFRTLK